MQRRRLARVGAVFVLMGAATEAYASQSPAVHHPPDPSAVDASEPPAEATTIYVVQQVGSDPRLREAMETARVQLRSQGLTLTIVELEPGENAAARARMLVEEGSARGVFWLDEHLAEELRVFLFDAQGSAYVRRVPIDPSGAEASREAVWLIVESGSLALAAGEAVAMEAAKVEELDPAGPEPVADPEPEPRSAPKAEPESEPKAEPEPAARGYIGVGYLGSGFASEVPWSSGVALDGTLDLGARWRLGLGYGLLLPWRSGDPVLTWRHRGELRGGPRFDIAPRVEVYGLVGGGVEALRWRPTSGAAGGWRVTGLLLVDGGVGVWLVPRLRVVFEPGVEVLLNRFDFVECAAEATDCMGTGRRVVLEPWRVRPRARVGLAVRF